jgi:hypothetical protein
MKISINEDEILLDLTQSYVKKVEEDKEIVLTKTNFLIPILKGIPKTYSYYNKNKVNPYYLNCSCKEYRDNIKMYPLRDLRRMCKHIFFILIRVHTERMDGLTKLLMEHRFWEKISEVIEINFNSEKLYISFASDLQFIRVYRKILEWKFYNYLPKKNSWENNLPPYKELENNSYLSNFLKKIISADFQNHLNSSTSNKKTA